jgi:hypothetical protein
MTPREIVFSAFGLCSLMIFNDSHGVTFVQISRPSLVPQTKNAHSRTAKGLSVAGCQKLDFDQGDQCAL